jgi:NAD(P)-dependent dehydrogenase (short-subunit alcohol dehydrogenase family)
MRANSKIRTYDAATSIVTGGASGIGRALVLELAARGSDVVIADVQAELAEQTRSEVEQKGRRAWVSPTDVSDAAAVVELVSDTLKRHGRLDYLFNNAGIAMGGPSEGFAADDWSRVIDVNLKGVAYGVHAAYPRMKEQGFGHIVNTASIGGLFPLPGTGAYVPTKYGVVGLTRALRAEARRHGVRVSALCPGMVATPILTGGKFGRRSAKITQSQLEQLAALHRAIAPEQVARRALNRLARNESVIVSPRYWQLVWWADRLAPAGLDRILSAILGRLERKLQKPE